MFKFKKYALYAFIVNNLYNILVYIIIPKQSKYMKYQILVDIFYDS